MSRRAGAVVFVLILGVHLVSPSVQVTDSRLSTYTAYDVLHHGSLDLRLLPVGARTQVHQDDYDVTRRRGSELPFFPYAPMVLLVPFVAAAELVGADPAGLELSDPNETWKIEIPAAALAVAMTGVVVALIAYALARGSHRVRQRTAVLAAVFFGFGTAAWSTGSRAFWQHTPAMLFVSLAVLQLVRSRDEPRSLALAGAFFAAAYVMRPATAAAGCVFAMWVVWSQRERFVTFVAGALAVLAPFVAVNLAAYHSVLPPYFSANRVGSEAALPFLEALAVHVVSPSRGVLVYTPLLLLIPWSLRLASRAGRDGSLYWTAAAAVVVHWIAVAAYGSTGGASYGARFFTEVTPVFVLLLVPLFNELAARTLDRTLAVATIALFGVSVLFAACGAVTRAGFCWSATPVFVDDAPHRVWSLSDPQFLRPARDLLDGRSAHAVLVGSCSEDVSSG